MKSTVSGPMNVQELRIRVAELLGWKWDLVEGRTYWFHPTHKDGRSFNHLPPDFTNDLNACHEAEKLLTQVYPGPFQMTDYVKHLQRIVGGVPGCFAQYCATAEQRCRAFIATMEGSSVEPAGNERG